MSIVKFYRNDPCAPKPNMPAHLGANAIIVWEDKLLLERRRDSDTWGLIGGGVKKHETELRAICREIYEELGVRVKAADIQKLSVYGEPGRIAAYRDGSIWRMVIVVFGLVFDKEPVLNISEESKELRFFTKDEIAQLDIVVTHSDIVQDWFSKTSWWNR
ncbi:MAG: NUDIX domain-containing protein [Oscillospiraceae bacterium]|nr:NUDIX domain-containing protein [Oscillospiraceae bacterium]